MIQPEMLPHCHIQRRLGVEGWVGGPSSFANVNGELGSSGKQRALIYAVSLKQVKSFLCATVLHSREHACQAEVTSDKDPVLTDL